MNARSVGVLLALVGLVAVAHPLYLYPHHGENQYYLSTVESVGDSAVAEQSPAEVIAYEELPPAAKDRFETEVDGGHAEGIWTGEHAASYDALADHEYVTYRGEYYEYRLRGADRFSSSGIVRMLLSTLAVVALVVGVFVARTGQFRPLTPRRAVWIPVGVFAALVATELYDVKFGGAHAPPSYVHLQAMVAAFVSASVVGSAVRDRGSFAPLVPVGVLVMVGTTYAIASGYASAVGSGAVAFVAVTGPWFVLGFAATEPRKPASWDVSSPEK